MNKPLENIFRKGVCRVEGSTSRLSITNISTGHGDDGLPVRFCAGDVGVVLVRVDVEVIWLLLVLSALNGLVCLAGESTRVNVGLVVQHIKNHAL